MPRNRSKPKHAQKSSYISKVVENNPAITWKAWLCLKRYSFISDIFWRTCKYLCKAYTLRSYLTTRITKRITADLFAPPCIKGVSGQRKFSCAHALEVTQTKMAATSCLTKFSPAKKALVQLFQVSLKLNCCVQVNQVHCYQLGNLLQLSCSSLLRNSWLISVRAWVTSPCFHKRPWPCLTLTRLWPCVCTNIQN